MGPGVRPGKVKPSQPLPLTEPPHPGNEPVKKTPYHLRAEFRQDHASVLKGPHCQMTMGSEGWLGHGKAEGLLTLKGFSQVP